MDTCACLATHLQDPDWKSREAAGVALRAVSMKGESAFVSSMSACLSDDHGSVRKTAAAALGGMCKKGAVIWVDLLRTM